MNLLTDDELAAAWAKSKGDILLRLNPFARSIEAAVIAKLGEPVAWAAFHEDDVLRMWAIKKEHVVSAGLDPEAIYRLPKALK